MKATIIIPTYWRGPAEEAPLCTVESDYLYDHSTPLDSDGTLRRALESLANLKTEHEFVVAVVAASTRAEIKQAVQLKVQAIIAEFDYDFPLFLIGPDELVLWRRRLAAAGLAEYDELLTLDGYSNVRNMCLLAAALTDAEAAILFDDDQVYEDPDYLDKALEFVGEEYEGKRVAGVAGYYLNADGDFLMRESGEDWEQIWGGTAARNEAFQMLRRPPRLKQAPFAFGGNMVIHRSLFERIPFDPDVPRGEDIDYLIDARLFGYDFFLDSELVVRHLPPPKCAPAWFQLRQDILRFSWERAKLASQPERDGARRLTAGDLDPYPGRFLRDDFVDIVFRTNVELAAGYLLDGLEEDARECMANIAIAKAESRIRVDAFARYQALQRKWEEFIAILPEVRIWSPAGRPD